MATIGIALSMWAASVRGETSTTLTPARRMRCSASSRASSSSSAAAASKSCAGVAPGRGRAAATRASLRMATTTGRWRAAPRVVCATSACDARTSTASVKSTTRARLRWRVASVRKAAA